jgi:hypothetical protein
VRSLEDVTLPGGRRVATITASIFHTAAGRGAVEYLNAVLASKSQTGLSISGPRESWKGSAVTRQSQRVVRYADVGLLEVSITRMQSVPGAVVTGLTLRPAEGRATQQQRAEASRRSCGWTPASERRGLATMAERITVLRQTYRPQLATMAERTAALRRLYRRVA